MDASPTPTPLEKELKGRSAGCDTPLAKWAEARGLTLRQLVKRTGLDHRCLAKVVEGRQMPSLVEAFQVERMTRGGVPVSSWLGTELGQRVWERACASFRVTMALAKERDSLPENRERIRTRWNLWYAANKDRVKAQREAKLKAKAP